MSRLRSTASARASRCAASSSSWRARHELRQPVAAHASPDLVSRRDRRERARVVDESGGVGEPADRRCGVEEAADADGAVEKPPRRAENERRVVAGKRRQLARERALVEGVGDEREPGIVPVRVQQLSEVARPFGANRDVGTDICPEAARTRRRGDCASCPRAAA